MQCDNFLDRLVHYRFTAPYRSSAVSLEGAKTIVAGAPSGISRDRIGGHVNTSNVHRYRVQQYPRT